jgi:hypothetical protein
MRLPRETGVMAKVGEMNGEKIVMNVKLVEGKSIASITVHYPNSLLLQNKPQAMPQATACLA